MRSPIWARFPAGVYIGEPPTRFPYIDACGKPGQNRRSHARFFYFSTTNAYKLLKLFSGAREMKVMIIPKILNPNSKFRPRRVSYKTRLLLIPIQNDQLGEGFSIGIITVKNPITFERFFKILAAAGIEPRPVAWKGGTQPS